jgi:hypothetical protein
MIVKDALDGVDTVIGTISAEMKKLTTNADKANVSHCQQDNRQGSIPRSRPINSLMCDYDENEVIYNNPFLVLPCLSVPVVPAVLCPVPAAGITGSGQTGLPLSVCR